MPVVSSAQVNRPPPERPRQLPRRFDTRRFSGFVELQKPGIKQAVVEASYILTDFAQWIHERKLEPLNTIRQLPRILRNPKAKDIFLKQGAREAVMVLERPALDEILAEADLGQLARALRQRVDTLPFQEHQRLKNYRVRAVLGNGVTAHGSPLRREIISAGSGRCQY